MDEIDILSKKGVQMPIDTWKDAQYHYSLGKHKLKSQGHTTSHPLRWLISKNQQTIIGENVAKLETLHTEECETVQPCLQC